MDENNNKSSYTGEYGNPVEGEKPYSSSTYSYSYKDGNNSVTHSGDYYPQNNSGDSTQQYSGDIKNQDSAGNDSAYPQETGNRQASLYGNSSGQDSHYNSMDNYNNSYSGNNGYYNNYNGGQDNGSKKNKKSMGTGKKLLITAACAVMFGVVAGVCFEAVHYVSDNVLGITAQNTKKLGTTTNSDSNKASTSKAGSGNVVSIKGAVTDVSGIVEQTMPAIVAITSTSEGTNYYDLFGQYYEQRGQTSCGSGFIVGQNDKELLIATNNHVISNAKTISVQFIDDEVYEAYVKGTAESNDLAVIAVNVKSIKPGTMDKIKIADLGSSDSLKVGEMAIAIGNSLGYGQSVTVGYISAKNREITEDSSNNTGVVNKIKVIQTDAAINPGNSGGALLNLKGQVIGINSAKIADSSVEGVGYAIPISAAIPVIDELMNKEKLSDNEKGYLGVSVRTVTDEASYYNIPNGAYVEAVSDGGAADKAGLKTGDIITSINNMEVTTKESLQEKVNSYRKGTEIEVIFQRSSNGVYEEKKVTVKLQGQDSLDGLPDDGTYTRGSEEGQDNSNPGSQGGNGFERFFSNPFSN